MWLVIEGLFILAIEFFRSIGLCAWHGLNWLLEFLGLMRRRV